MTNKELTLATLMRAMIKYDGGDAPRIQHFVKVHDFARMIAIAEGMNEEDLFVDKIGGAEDSDGLSAAGYLLAPAAEFLQ